MRKAASNVYSHSAGKWEEFPRAVNLTSEATCQQNRAFELPRTQRVESVERLSPESGVSVARLSVQHRNPTYEVTSVSAGRHLDCLL